VAVFRILGDEVVTRSEYFQKLANGGPSVAAMQNLANHPLKEAFAEAAVGVVSPPGAPGFTPIGKGLPLSILIRYVYTGKHPKWLFGSSKPMCVVTGLKNYSDYAPSSRAVNYLRQDISPHTGFVAPPTYEAGTNVVAYSPALLSDSLHFTVEMAFDRFPDQLMKTISETLGSLAGIPLLVPAQGYLLAASTVINVASQWTDALVDGKASFSITDSLDFDLPGVAPPPADFRVLADDPALLGMKFDPAHGLVGPGGTPYGGDSPYVVISLDGKERDNLKGFAPTVAAAGIIKQFFNMRDLGQATADAVLAGAKLLNDMKYRQEALDLKAKVQAETDPDKKQKLEDQLKAILKNIQTTELKPS
jgi:hypothetical protein